ncbi:MAG: hypothetical protein KAT16_04815 [Candidatus Heimdallarchaeota archaeon]|nr:hypothetical protein [Candidatus Heimdallarchaeota archaeon]
MSKTATTPLHVVMSYLNYSGTIIDTGMIPKKSVEISSACVSDNYLFYNYLKQGFLVHLSPFFQRSYFRVRYFNYQEGKYWP